MVGHLSTLGLFRLARKVPLPKGPNFCTTELGGRRGDEGALTDAQQTAKESFMDAGQRNLPGAPSEDPDDMKQSAERWLPQKRRPKNAATVAAAREAASGKEELPGQAPGPSNQKVDEEIEVGRALGRQRPKREVGAQLRMGVGCRSQSGDCAAHDAGQAVPGPESAMLDGCEAAKTRLARRYRLLCTETSVLAMVHNAEAMAGCRRGPGAADYFPTHGIVFAPSRLPKEPLEEHRNDEYQPQEVPDWGSGSDMPGMAMVVMILPTMLAAVKVSVKEASKAAVATKSLTRERFSTNKKLTDPDLFASGFN
ncbi:hypothetical protein AK812_SmicGene42057 [Symbiodinium microadriaticum]|uniref:Uncharacterized protein n=1 Tax=Symbiodinium microadriaticum TaxID=2951 RepID=A0A1Q9C4J8_SYMMI|nr:hypothetical protein AK812_SmicGene42057 [Symbiodinium microadriaticum]